MYVICSFMTNCDVLGHGTLVIIECMFSNIILYFLSMFAKGMFGTAQFQ